MKRKLLLPLALKAVTSAMGVDVQSLITDELVEAIAQVEGNDPNKMGAHGERGWWQMRKCAVDDVNTARFAWRQEQASFEEIYGDRDCQKEYAIQYLYLLASRFNREFGFMPTPKVLLAMWNAGQKATKRIRFRNWRMPREMFDYANRVLNVRDKLLAEKDAKTEADLRERGRRLMTKR